MSAANEALALRFFEEMCNGRRMEVADEILTADHAYHDPHSPPLGTGPDAMKETVATYQSIDGHWDVHDVFSTEDRVAVRWTGTGSHKVDLMGVPATGRDIRVEAITILRIEDGRIAENWTNWDTLTLLQQIGAVP